ncbi:tRNA (adenosine(37)-N6)-dimethylallyltransferase MiaA [Dongia soli]|uniref:tRNA dimethylallyltransferase n=1 Tax=Dongia soli TaxID=600628 RepID=A0ABU5EDJ1_9PROT|nr:tRNA (adenosine(37)-N6)-dimethylallyltransferase MiaA [Dongia soli]MDY0884276.1 tRNA (adenosine(37)-N6)-dimethylallyltransferase MiaA [Dongia soli]
MQSDISEAATSDKESAKRPVIVIGGPTASGKSALAMRVAQAFSGVIINADSMQIYGDLPILTAQPDAADLAAVPHRLYGFLRLDDACSAARWAELALTEIRAAQAQGKLPILVGGTGLYLRSLMQGLSPIPEIPPVYREAAMKLLKELGVAGLHGRLAAEDLVMGQRLHPNDTQRVVRAWEVLQGTGRSLGEWHQLPPEPPEGLRFQCWVVLPPRDLLYAACDRRFETMIARGALPEVAVALAAYGGNVLRAPGGKSLGFRELADVINGRRDGEAAIAAAQQATRNYAKRQTTWFRHQMEFGNFMSPDNIEMKFSESSLQRIFQNIRDFMLTPD